MPFDPREEKFLHTLPPKPGGIPAIRPPGAPRMAPVKPMIPPAGKMMAPPKQRWAKINEFLKPKNPLAPAMPAVVPPSKNEENPE